MRAAYLSAFTMGMAICLAQPTVTGEFKYRLGQVWTYNHEGPQPWGTKDATGPRTRRVLRVQEAAGKKCWVIEDRWQNGERWIEQFIARDSSVIQHVLHGGQNQDLLQFEPPLEDPFFNLAPGEEKEVEGEIVFYSLPERKEQGRFPYTRRIKRLPDESVTVQAGKFDNCRRIRERMVLHAEYEETKVDFVGIREAWWSPEKGLVKETFVAEPVKGPDGTVQMPERRSKSVLRSFAVEQ